MLVRVNPARLEDNKDFKVHHPVSGRPFPSPDPFDMPATDLENPRIVRLFAKPGESGGIAGGVFGDLIAVAAESAPLVAEATESTTKKKG